MVGFDLGPLLQGQTRIAKLKSAYNSLIIGPRGLGLFYVTFNTVQVISRWVVGRAEETSTYSSSGFCTVNCQPTASNYQLSHLRLYRESNPGVARDNDSPRLLTGGSVSCKGG